MGLGGQLNRHEWSKDDGPGMENHPGWKAKTTLGKPFPEVKY